MRDRFINLFLSLILYVQYTHIAPERHVQYQGGISLSAAILLLQYPGKYAIFTIYIIITIHTPTTHPTHHFIPVSPPTVRPAEFPTPLLFPPGAFVAAGINVIPLITNVLWNPAVLVLESGGPVVGTIERVLLCVGMM
jgi:hypothetical protein